MDKPNPNSLVLIIEDDADDYAFLEEALKEADIYSKLKWFKDSESFSNYIAQNSEKIKKSNKDKIALILLDLNMPKKSGFDLLREMNKHPSFKIIPTIIFTTSSSQSDIKLAYDLGANSYIKKPEKYSDYLTATKVLHSYWFDTVALPIK